MATFSKTDLATFRMELFVTIGNGRVYNQWTVLFACCCCNATIIAGRIKIGWKWPWLEGGIRYDFLFCRNIFLKTPITFCSSNFLFHFENLLQKWKLVPLSISSSEVLLTEATINICSEKFLLIECSKNSCNGVIFLKN